MFPISYALDDDEVFGGVDVDKLLDVTEETCYYSASQQSAIEQELFFYLIAKEMWNFIKETNNTECTMCTHPERSLSDAKHSCIYLQALYFVTPPYRLQLIIDTYYNGAIKNKMRRSDETLENFMRQYRGGLAVTVLCFFILTTLALFNLTEENSLSTILKGMGNFEPVMTNNKSFTAHNLNHLMFVPQVGSNESFYRS